jgi:hypothetical protein
MKAMALFLLVAVCSACASNGTPTSDQTPPKFSLSVSDKTLERQFNLVFHSDDERNLCFPVEQWPSSAGSLDSGSQRAVLVSGEHRMPAFDDNFGYCPGGCGFIRVRPGEELRGRITYSQFGDPKLIAAFGTRTLSFSLYPKICGRGAKIVPPR